MSYGFQLKNADGVVLLDTELPGMFYLRTYSVTLGMQVVGNNTPYAQQFQNLLALNTPVPPQYSTPKGGLGHFLVPDMPTNREVIWVIEPLADNTGARILNSDTLLGAHRFWLVGTEGATFKVHMFTTKGVERYSSDYGMQIFKADGTKIYDTAFGVHLAQNLKIRGNTKPSGTITHPTAARPGYVFSGFEWAHKARAARTDFVGVTNLLPYFEWFEDLVPVRKGLTSVAWEYVKPYAGVSFYYCGDLLSNPNPGGIVESTKRDNIRSSINWSYAVFDCSNLD